MAKKKLTWQQRQQQHMQQLEQRRDELQRLHKQLQQTNAELNVQAVIMDSMCDSLSALLQRQGGGSAAVADEDAVELLDLLEEEGGLLQQLADLPAPLLHTAVPSEGDAEQQQQPMPISPPNDPMALFKHLLSQPRVDLSQMTLEDVRASYTELVHGVSIQLNMHSAGLLSEACVASRIQPGIVKFLSMSHQLMREGRRDLGNGLLRLRLDVPACQPATDAAAPACPEGPAAADLAATVVAKLDLSAPQEETIDRGLVFFRRLLQLVDTQLAALQQGVPPAAGAGTPTPQVPHSGSSNGSGNSSGSRSSSCANGPSSSKDSSGYEAVASSDGASPSAPLDEQGELLAARQVELDAQQRRAMRLQVVCRKHALVTSAAMAWLTGQFTWLQLGKLAVLFWPYVPVWQHLWAAISRQWQERQRLQQNGAAATTAAVASTTAAAAQTAAVEQTAAAAAATAPPAWERLHTPQQGCAANGSSVHAATSSISQKVQQ